MPNHLLIDADDSILVVIDVQSAFVNKLLEDQRQPLVNRICWLIGTANWLNIPLVVTAEDVSSLGGVVPEVESSLPENTQIQNKMAFGLAGNPDILAAVEQTGRKTAVIAGLETDVCVAQSAIGLFERGYKVVVPADAVATRGTPHILGLERMRGAGVIITCLKSLLYEWTRTVERTKRFHLDWRNTLPSNLGWEGYWKPVDGSVDQS